MARANPFSVTTPREIILLRGFTHGVKYRSKHVDCQTRFRAFIFQDGQALYNRGKNHDQEQFGHKNDKLRHSLSIGRHSVNNRIDSLVNRLQKGIDKTLGTLNSLSQEQWQMVLYEEPYPWTVRDILAHLLWTEEGLIRIAQDIATGGPGAPEGLDYDKIKPGGLRRA
jgi:hypothetical protein